MTWPTHLTMGNILLLLLLVTKIPAISFPQTDFFHFHIRRSRIDNKFSLSSRDPHDERRVIDREQYKRRSQQDDPAGSTTCCIFTQEEDRLMASDISFERVWQGNE